MKAGEPPGAIADPAGLPVVAKTRERPAVTASLSVTQAPGPGVDPRA